MGLNELLYHHQMALMAVSRPERGGRATLDFDLPCYYAKRINEYRELRGLNFGVLAVAPSGRPAANSVGSEPTEFVGDVLSAQRGEALL